MFQRSLGLRVFLECFKLVLRVFQGLLKSKSRFVQEFKGTVQQLSKGQLSKETIVQGTVVQGAIVQGDFCPRKTFVQEVKYLYFCPRNFCYRNEEKNLKIAGNKKI